MRLKLRDLFFSLILLCMVQPCIAANATIPLVWDPSTTPSITGNPVNYRLYICSDTGLTTCSTNEVGTATTFAASLSSGTYYLYVTAWNYSMFDGTNWTVQQESGKSNILAIQLQVPPGNPGNLHIKIPGNQ